MRISLFHLKVSLTCFALDLVMILVPDVVMGQDANDFVVIGLTSARIMSLLLVLISATSLFISLWAKNGSIGLSKKRAVIIAFVLGLLSVIASVINISSTKGFGTGGGKAGAVLALVLGVIGVCLTIRIFIHNRKITSFKSRR